MTEARGDDEIRRSRWLPATVISVFALIVVVDLALLVVHDDHADMEDDDFEVVFRPVSQAADDPSAIVVDVESGAPVVSADGKVVVDVSDGALSVRAPGALIIRFRSTDAGSKLLMNYRFGRRRPDARCDLRLARVASRYGVDTVWRKSLRAKQRRKGKIRHYLADHAGWFELAMEVNAAAAEIGFETTLPEIYRD